MFVLAEISDKLPSVPATFAVSLALTMIALASASLKWWLAALVLPLFGYWNWAVYCELQEGSFAALIWDEMGAPYIAGRFASINLPPTVGAVLTLRLRRGQARRQRRA